jgi:hypothetical protein
MSGNPLEPDAAREQRIRELAYQLWEADGSPHGRDLEFWERARELVGMEEHPNAALLPNPQNSGKDPDAPMVEEAELEENLGEFPGRMTDQGDREPTPHVRAVRKSHNSGSV